ncbi:hypothetical protein F5Y17DRAFT_89580 [Xylariaceae sp. FL0594]|nr:hypothetical protein F5Y17DRAFT_89580 [Xylariaceae sp. FL0594]
MQIDPQGNKVACGPCIRGHRSSLCKHDDRQLLRVNKPGRPLSTCPHPKGSGCNCNTRVTIAIPRNRKCACGPGSGANTTAVTTTASGDATAQVPRKSGASRVQKNSISIPPSRKQSFDLAGLDRMNPDNINIIPSHTLPVRKNENTGPGDVASPPSLGSDCQPNNPQHCGLAVFDASPTPTQPGNPAALIPDGTFLSAQRLLSNPSPSGSPMQSSSGRSSIDAFQTFDDTPASSVSSVKDEIPAGAGSCCAKKRATGRPSTQDQTSEVGSTQSSVNLMGYGAFAAAQDPNMPAAFFPPAGFAPMMSYAPTAQSLRQSTGYTYPYPYGSYQAPLQYYQWEQMVANPEGNVTPLTSYTGSQPPTTQSTEAQADAYMTHQCSCGPGCQCVGCTVHPFNSATKEVVRSMVPMLEAQGYSDGCCGTAQVANGASYGIVPLPLANNLPSPATGFDNMMPPGGPETNQLSWDDYLFVDYGAFFGCKGDLGTCPCGDDCVCTGCTLHRPTQPITPPS